MKKLTLFLTQLEILGSIPGWNRKGWAHFLSPNANIHLAENQYLGVGQLLCGCTFGRVSRSTCGDLDTSQKHIYTHRLPVPGKTVLLLCY